MLKKIISSIMAVAMLASIGTTVMAGAVGSTAPTTDNQGDISLRAFHRYYSTQINSSSYTEVMYDTNTWADDMVTVYFDSTTGAQSVTYRLIEIMSGAEDKVTYFTLSVGQTYKVSIKAANNFRLAAKGSGGTITTYVTLATN